jgi:predicted permease
VLESVRQMPGVASAAVTGSIPFAGTQDERSQFQLTIKGRDQDSVKVMVPLQGADVSPDYFQTMRIPLRRGRLFAATDTATSPFVAIISERGARMLFPDRDPIGQEILWGTLTPTNPYCRVVGVVGNVRRRAGEPENGFEIYYPVAQWPVATSFYVVRTNIDPASLGETIRRTIQAADARFAVTEIKTMERRIGESLWRERLWSVMFGGFAVLALALAAIGLYGLMAHGVIQRQREIGIRMALGAQPVGVRRMIVREAIKLALIGIVLGAAGMQLVSKPLAALLHGLPTHGVATILVVASVLCLSALAAAWIPAHRASRVDPLKALQAE